GVERQRHSCAAHLHSDRQERARSSCRNGRTRSVLRWWRADRDRVRTRQGSLGPRHVLRAARWGSQSHARGASFTRESSRAARRRADLGDPRTQVEWNGGTRGEGPRVTRVVRHSPASRAGLRGGEQILAINGRKVGGMGEREVRSAINANIRTGLDLHVRSSGELKRIKVEEGPIYTLEDQ